MKFDSRKPVDVSSWQTPIKLNRKELTKEEAPVARVAVGPMLGTDGKPVVGADGNVVMVDAEGKPITNTEEKDKKGKGPANGRKKFQKKTRQVFLVPEETRQLRKEERYPWVMEDATQKELWVGKLEDVSKAETHAFFMPLNTEIFKFVPAHRWYKFQKKPNYHVPNLKEAEELMTKIQKHKDPQTWLFRNRAGQRASEATMEMFNQRTKRDPDEDVQSAAPGGRKLRTTDRGPSGLFGDDEDDEAGRGQKKEDNEGDLDEMEFEEEFADDEDMNVADNDDEEAKELEERLKREYKNANKQREGYVDESEEEEEDPSKRKGVKAMKKLIRNLEKNNAYESDEEGNPYASSEEEEEEEEDMVPVTNEPAIQPQQQQQQQTESRAGSQQPSVKPSLSRPPTNTPGSGSRATSPAPSQSMGGHSLMAKRATSPKAPKVKAANVSRGNSPLSGQSPASRATSPVAGSRATSPVANAGSPGSDGASTSMKRKATDEISNNAVNGTTNGAQGTPKLKKRKAVPAGGAAGELDEKMVIDWLKNTPSASTRDCIQHFTPYLTDEAKKTKFTALVKEVAQLKGGVLVLRNAYRGGSAAASPAPT